MTKEVGISIYPIHVPLKKNLEYIEKAAYYGFTRAFTCLLSINMSEKDRIIKEFKETICYAEKLGLKVIADVSPSIFEKLGITYQNLDFFADLGASGIRLDLGFTGNEESLMTFNPFNLKIELNMSNDTHYIDTIIDHIPNTENLYGSHNFYPHKFSGLGRKHFIKCSKHFRSYGLRTGAFVKAPSANIFYSLISDGLCSLEEHRYKSLRFQTKDLFMTGLIDTVQIAECFASDQELEAMANVNRDLLELDAILVSDLPKLQKSMLLDTLHFHRGDASEYLIRSTQGRVIHKGKSFPPKNTAPIKKGDILIDNDTYGNYTGEIGLALQDMSNSGRTNIVGRLSDEDINFLPLIRPWQKFRLTELK